MIAIGSASPVFDSATGDRHWNVEWSGSAMDFARDNAYDRNRILGDTLRKFEAPNSGMPVHVDQRNRGVFGRVFLSVPKSTIVIWINWHGTVIAPAIKRETLNPEPGEHHCLALGEIVERIGRKAAGIVNRWIVTWTTRAVTDGDVAHVVHCGAAHPPPEWIRGIERSKSALLINRRCAAEVADFVPT